MIKFKLCSGLLWLASSRVSRSCARAHRMPRVHQNQPHSQLCRPHNWAVKEESWRGHVSRRSSPTNHRSNRKPKEWVDSSPLYATFCYLAAVSTARSVLQDHGRQGSGWSSAWEAKGGLEIGCSVFSMGTILWLIMKFCLWCFADMAVRWVCLMIRCSLWLFHHV